LTREKWKQKDGSEALQAVSEGVRCREKHVPIQFDVVEVAIIKGLSATVGVCGAASRSLEPNW
jgi:hypothetical protein